MEFSNVLMGIAVIAVVLAGVNVIMVSTELSPTGRLSDDSGTADVEIASSINIRFIVSALDWGKGSVLTDPATLDSVTAPYYDGNWLPDTVTPDLPTLTGGLELENYGNVDVDLRLESNKDAGTFICNGDVACSGSAFEAFNWRLEDIEALSCGDKDIDNLAPNPDVIWDGVTWVPVGIVPGGTLFCDQFKSAEATNTVEIDFQLVIPSNAPVGPRTAIITALAVQSL